MYCFVILVLFNEMQLSVRRFSAIPHLRAPKAREWPARNCNLRVWLTNLVFHVNEVSLLDRL